MEAGSSRVDRSAVEAFILAGGPSRRMGTDEARLQFNGMPLVSALARRIAPAVARVRVVAKPGASFEDCGLECVHDLVSAPALVHGIDAALAAEGAPWRWLLACDMPAVDAAVLAALWETARSAASRGAAPHLTGREDPEPLPSLWHRDLSRAVRPEWGWSARTWVRRAGLARWEVPAALEELFVNVNTSDEWEAFLAGRPGGWS